VLFAVAELLCFYSVKRFSITKTAVFADIAAMDACRSLHMCVPVMDTLLANTQYGVLSFSWLDLDEICL